ncbi:MAG: DUF1360 domain-containing protein [Chloroflexi bacterium]|nr:MAG: DUF1360 domain-containing protein [Chloroflexota bacterium]
MTFVVFSLFALATWRLSSMLVRERGPWNLFVWVRERAGIGHDEKGLPYMVPDNVLAGILSCTWCASMWVAFGWFLFFLIAPLLATKIATVFAFSAGAILVDRWMGN